MEGIRFKVLCSGCKNDLGYDAEENRHESFIEIRPHCCNFCEGKGIHSLSFRFSSINAFQKTLKILITVPQMFSLAHNIFKGFLFLVHFPSSSALVTNSLSCHCFTSFLIFTWLQTYSLLHQIVIVTPPENSRTNRMYA